MVEYQIKRMKEKKRVALIAHDAKKQDLLDWVEFNKGSLSEHELYATGTTGEMIETLVGLEITKLQSGPLGGDARVSAMIAENEIDIIIFFWDPMETLPHEHDIKALLRLAVVYNIPVACSRSTADFVVSSPLMSTNYNRVTVDYVKEREKEKILLMEDMSN